MSGDGHRSLPLDNFCALDIYFSRKEGTPLPSIKILPSVFYVEHRSYWTFLIIYTCRTMDGHRSDGLIVLTILGMDTAPYSIEF